MIRLAEGVKAAPPLPAASGKRPLFGLRPAAEIARVLRNDAARFTDIAWLMCGLRQKFVDAVVELNALYDEFRRDEQDAAPLDALFDMLIDRTDWLCVIDGSRDRALRFVWDTFGFAAVTGRTYSQWLVKRASDAKLRAQQERDAQRAARDAVRQARGEAQARATILSRLASEHQDEGK